MSRAAVFAAVLVCVAVMVALWTAPGTPGDSTLLGVTAGPQEWQIGMITDLDKASRDPHHFRWRAVLQRAFISRDADANFAVRMGPAIDVVSATATRNRSMELSSLILWEGMLLGTCDFTGIVYRIMPETGDAVPRYVLSDGDGKKSKAFKSEWSTVKDGDLYVGSIGHEWFTLERPGAYAHRNAEWVKRIDRSGKIHNLNWHDRYIRLRHALNASSPGYLTHEAWEWHPGWGAWVVAPRKVSSAPLELKADERRASNRVVVLDDAPSAPRIRVFAVGDLEPEWGFTAVRYVPGTRGLFAAIKAREIADATASKICLFQIPDPWQAPSDVVPMLSCDAISDVFKFEGLAVL